MKKYIWNLLVMFICSSTMIASNIISLQTTKTKSGDNGKFSIIMKNDVSVNGLHFILKYEPDLITPTKITPTDRGASLTGSAASLSGDDKINFVVYDNGFNLASSDSGKIFEVEYIVTDSLGDSATTQLIFTEAMAADSGLMIIPFEFINGEISIDPAVDVLEPPNALPFKYALFQNYPNPFNPSTTICFDLPRISNVSLIVYNIVGQQVVTLVNGKYEAGKYNIVFDGTKLASGIYFYRLQTEQYANTKKFILLK